MGIVFKKETQQFYLSTEHTSYIIELLDRKILLHAYWGKKLENMLPLISWGGVAASRLPICDVNCPPPFQSSNSLPMEYPTYGTGDMREPAFFASYEDGSRVTSLEYRRHKIYSGKPKLSGLPSSYSDEDDVETLEIELSDDITGLQVTLNYSVFDKKDVITRSVKVRNCGNGTINIEKLASASFESYDADFDVLHLHGDWAREFQIERNAVQHGIMHFNSKCGKSGHLSNPAAAVLEKNAGETFGNVYGIGLIYSGNFDISTEKNSLGSVRTMIGINSFDFSWKLEQGESLQSPEAVMVYSDCGLGLMSRRFHRFYRENLCRGVYKNKERPVLVNNWEATYFDFCESKLLDIAKSAKQIGIDLFVLDDGWFGKRNSENSSLGDWFCNYEKLPNGLAGLGKKILDTGLKFGIWMEPEMVSPDSELYRNHPDWCIHINGRNRNLSRNQLILDLSRGDVCRYITDSVSAILNSADISYVKWDMNRCFSDIGSDKLPSDRQKELAHRYMLGLYGILEELTSRFPNVLFENCSSGGGRYDPGMMYYMPQTWCSDDSDALERMYIQYGASLFYPASTMGAHVSVCPNHQVGRTTPLKMRGDAALLGVLGYEMDLSRASREELELMAQQISFYKQYRDVTAHGDLYRLSSPFEEPFAAWQFISKDSETVLLFAFVLRGRPAEVPKRVILQALDEDGYYEDEIKNRRYSGAFLMNVGLLHKRDEDYISKITVLKKLK